MPISDDNSTHTPVQSGEEHHTAHSPLLVRAGQPSLGNSTNVRTSTVDEDVAQAIQIVRAPAAKATSKRYEVPIRMYEEILREMDIDLQILDTSGERDRSKDPVAAGLKLILRRCSPKDEGRGYEGLSASATGTACKSAVVAYWRSYGHFSNYTEYPDGSYS